MSNQFTNKRTRNQQPRQAKQRSERITQLILDAAPAPSPVKKRRQSKKNTTNNEPAPGPSVVTLMDDHEDIDLVTPPASEHRPTSSASPSPESPAEHDQDSESTDDEHMDQDEGQDSETSGEILTQSVTTSFESVFDGATQVIPPLVIEQADASAVLNQPNMAGILQQAQLTLQHPETPQTLQSESALNECGPNYSNALLETQNAINKGIHFSNDLAKAIHKALEQPLRDPRFMLSAASIGKEVLEITTRTNEAAMLYIKTIAEKIEKFSSPPSPPPRPPPLIPLAAAPPATTSTYAISIAYTRDAQRPAPLKQVFEEATLNKGVHVVRHNDRSTNSYTAVLLTKNMVETASKALNDYILPDGTRLNTLIDIGKEVASSYSVRSGHIPAASIKPFLQNSALDFSKLQQELVARNCGWWTASDIESISHYKVNETKNPNAYVLKIYMSIDALLRILASPEANTTIYIQGKTFRIYEEINMPQCQKCHWVGHNGESCTFGTWCAYCGAKEHNLSTCNFFNQHARDQTKVACHRCIENNQAVIDSAQNTAQACRFYTFFPRWIPTRTDHMATYSSCPALMQNREWIRLDLKSKAALQKRVDLRKAPLPPEGPGPLSLLMRASQL